MWLKGVRTCIWGLAVAAFMGVLGCRGTHNSRAAGEREIAQAAQSLDIGRLEAWGKSLATSGELARLRGAKLAVPNDCWKSSAHPPFSVEVLDFSGDLFVCVFFQFGSESSGLAIGADGAQFRGHGFSYKRSPGVYYFRFWN